MVYINRSADKQFYFTTEATNGENLDTGEMHTTKEKCIQSIAAMCRAFHGCVIVTDRSFLSGKATSFRVNEKGKEHRTNIIL